MENSNAILDMYELSYRNHKCNEQRFQNIDIENITISESTNTIIMKTLNTLKHLKSKDVDEIKFSDVIYSNIPVVEKSTNIITSFAYIPFGKKNTNIKENINRYRRMDINNLPLIDIAKYLNIKIEKSNTLDAYGCYVPSEQKIILGSDYAPTFIHELIHAIDCILPNRNADYYFRELVAELTTIAVCMANSIPIDISYSKFYLDGYTDFDLDLNDILKRVSLIYEYIVICNKILEERK
jgi:hypothetical protein